MKVININPGLLPIPPNGWGAIEKIIWDYHQEMIKVGIRSEIKYTDEVKYDDSVVIHVHVANLANMLHERGMPYIFTIHDHHAYLYGKDSSVFKENLKAIENSVISLSPCKYLIPYFGSKKLRYFSHAVNTDLFVNHNKPRNGLLCVANNGYAYDQTKDRKGFKIAIQAAMALDMPITIAGPKNNNNFFNTLEPELNNYAKLTKLFDLDEYSLIELYNKHDVFLHLSELEAGHPNLTLLEAMACGLPIVGTFEDNKYDGICIVKRDLNETIAGIKEVYLNYGEYQKKALDNAKRNSYANRVHELAGLYSEYRESIFGNKLISHYSDAKINHVDAKNKINLWFPSGPKVEILGPVSKKYKVKFINKENGQITYETILNNNMWAVSNIRYFCRWKIEVYEIVGENWEKLELSHELDLTNKNIKIILDTSSLGDLMAYIGAVEKFRKINNCNLTCVVYHDDIIKIFQNSYPDIKFIRYNDSNDSYYATYNIGYFDQNNWSGNSPFDPKISSLATIAQDILGLPSIEIRPKLKFKIHEKPIKKYVCIGTQSTAQSKYWNNPNGWTDVIKHLNSIGYEVWCIDKNSSFGRDSNMNYIPFGAIDKTGDFSLEERLSQIYNSEFFIGLGSGLSWLAWASGREVILISGFSLELAEFFTPYRVINKKVCHGCWNDSSCTFDKGDWKWCPRNKDFECTRTISSEMVISQIDKLVNKEFDKVDWGIQPVHSKFILLNEMFSEKDSIYEKIFKIEKNDVVLDIGAHVGLFSVVAKKKGASKIIAVEPSAMRLQSLQKNLSDIDHVIIPHAVSDTAGLVKSGLIYDKFVEDMSVITFDEVLKNYNLPKIDFMKVDCEGGEYEIFSQKYIEWIKNNVRKISGEWHLSSHKFKSQFVFFRNEILSKHFQKYKAYSVDNVDITWQLFNSEFVDRYTEFTIHIDNRNE